MERSQRARAELTWSGLVAAANRLQVQEERVRHRVRVAGHALGDGVARPLVELPGAGAGTKTARSVVCFCEACGAAINPTVVATRTAWGCAGADAENIWRSNVYLRTADMYSQLQSMTLLHEVKPDSILRPCIQEPQRFGKSRKFQGVASVTRVIILECR